MKIANVKDGNIMLAGCSYVDRQTAERACEWRLKRGDILIAMTGYIGDVARVRSDDWVMLNQRVGRFTVLDKDSLDSDYLYTFLRFKETKQRIESLGYGSAQPNVSPSLIGTIAIPLPPLKEQQAIAAILGALDDKIENNRRTNETLEAMARAIFKSWFVDFDPVHAKAAGQRPTGMDDATAALFPSEFQDSPLGPIPKGWDIGTVADLGEVICGKTPPSKNADCYGGGIPFITIPDMHGKTWVSTTGKMLTKLGNDFQPKKLVPRYSICVSCIATPGLVAMASKDSHSNQQINTVVPPSLPDFFTFEALRLIGRQISDHGSGGSVFANLNKTNFSLMKLLLPETTLRSTFNACTEALYHHMLALLDENEALATTRDTLLPKLLSGELRLPQADALVEAAV